MKMTFPRPFPWLAALGLLVFAAPVRSVRAGSAVATDGHGGYGYSFGDRPLEQLQHEAVRQCREKSAVPDDVHVIVTTRHGGAGVIVRFYVDGQARIYAYVGAASDRQAYDYATGYVEGYGGKKIEVVARWRD